jgi:hypothetical protein
MVREVFHQFPLKRDPIGGRMELEVRQFNLSVAQILGVELDLYIRPPGGVFTSCSEDSFLAFSQTLENELSV